MKISLLQDLFLDAVQKYPNKTALVCANEEWTYKELYCKSLGVAAQIRHKLSRHSSSGCIGIYGDKSLSSVAAILGTLLSGYTYMPIDITLPASRIDNIIETSKPLLLLVTECTFFIEQQLTKLNTKIPKIDILNECTVFDKLDNNSCNDNAEKIAYLLFTSGTTGTPKGVCVSHRAALCAIDMLFEHIDFDEDTKIANQAALCYDLSMFDLFSAFKVGATVHLLSQETTRVPQLFLESILKQKLNSLFIVTSSLEYLLKYTTNIDYKLPLKHLLLTGEMISNNLLLLLQQRLNKDTKLWNLYSATEMPYAFAQQLNFAVIEEQLNRFDLHGSKIHYDINNDQCESDKQLGELVVESPVLFSGYLTAENHLRSIEQDPIKLYSTGDLVIKLEKGIELLGRRDRQVKIRGNRIELDDIEVNIEKFPNVLESIIAYDKNKYEITAFIVMKNRSGSISEELDHIKQQCKNHLPAIMIPHRFIIIDEIPRTVSGKKDRKSVIKNYEPLLSQSVK